MTRTPPEGYEFVLDASGMPVSTHGENGPLWYLAEGPSAEALRWPNARQWDSCYGTRLLLRKLGELPYEELP